LLPPPEGGGGAHTRQSKLPSLPVVILPYGRAERRQGRVGPSSAPCAAPGAQPPAPAPPPSAGTAVCWPPVRIRGVRARNPHACRCGPPAPPVMSMRVHCFHAHVRSTRAHASTYQAQGFGGPPRLSHKHALCSIHVFIATHLTKHTRTVQHACVHWPSHGLAQRTVPSNPEAAGDTTAGFSRRMAAVPTHCQCVGQGQCWL
jgi:hypothetical protein